MNPPNEIRFGTERFPEFLTKLRELYPDAQSMQGTLYANGVTEISWSIPDDESFAGRCVARWGVYGIDEGEIYL